MCYVQNCFLSFCDTTKTNSSSSNGTHSNEILDLLQQTPRITPWIASLNPKYHLVIGGYAYLDSALFVRLAIAMDANTVLKTRNDAALAFLCSTTDVFVTWKKVLAYPLDKRRLKQLGSVGPGRFYQLVVIATLE
jgi:hypothetical protein